MTDLTDPSSTIPDDVLGRYLAGEASLADRTTVERWAAADPTNARQLDLLRSAWSARESSPRYDTSAQVKGVLARIEYAAPTSVRPTRRPAAGSDRGRLRVWAIGGAAVAAGAILAFVAEKARLFPALPQPVREFATPAGGRGTVTLRDGTQLVLGPSTRLRVPSDFGRVARAVELDGEAEFRVVHDGARPFSVRTKGAVMRDIGTTFVVRAYADDAELRLAVIEGKVAIDAVMHGTARTADLDAQSEARVGADGSFAVRRAVSLARDIAWIQGGLAFEAMPLREVAREVGRTYGVEIAIADTALAAKRITSTFGTETVDEVLDAITRAIGARYERAGRLVTIRLAGLGARGGRLESQPLTSAQTIRRGQ